MMIRTVTLIAVATVTRTPLAVWVATGRHAYTKFEVVERVEVSVDPDDPFAQAGLYDDRPHVETVRRDEFHLGLLPVPQGLFDKHVISVITIIVPVWIVSLLIRWRLRRNRLPQPRTTNIETA